MLSMVAEYAEFFLISFVSLFVILDPMGLAPSFLTLTRDYTYEERVQTARWALLFAFGVLVVCSFGGQQIFHFFNITLPAVEISGGIILLLIALDMLQAHRPATRETPEERKEGIEKEDVAMTPLGMPLLAGPGAITTIILLSSRHSGLVYRGIVLLNLALVLGITYLIFDQVSKRSHKISVTFMRIVTRMMGLLLSALAIQFILNGIRGAQLF